MPKKFVLLPEEVFQDFMARSGEATTRFRDPRRKRRARESLPVHEAVEKTLTDRTLNPSARNELYQQNLGAYLKHKRTEAERPMRVRMAHSPDAYDNSIWIRKEPGAVFSTEDDDDDDEVQSYDPTKTPGSPSSSSSSSRASTPTNVTPTPIRVSYLNQTPNRSQNRALQRIENVSRKGRRLKDKSLVKETILKAAKTVYKELSRNAKYYRIAKDGKILREDRRGTFSGSKNSDALLAIRKILGDKDVTEVPTGFAKFQKFLEGDGVSAELLTEAKAHISQIGSGWLLSSAPARVKRSKIKRIGTPKFRVQRWGVR